MALNIFEELDLTSSGDNVDDGFLKCKNNWAELDILLPGYFQRSKFTYADANTITVGAGVYSVNGTFVKIASDIATTSHGEIGDNWVYLYIDYSSIPSDGVLLQSDIIWSTTEPAWSDSLLGWYNGDDRCIFSVYISSNDILEFFHDRDFVLFADRIVVISAAAVGSSYADIGTAFTMPMFARRVNAYVSWTYVDDTVGLWWRTNGQTSSAGHLIGTVLVGVTTVRAITNFITDSGHLIELKESQPSTNTCTIHENGWYLPEGI